MRRAMWTAALTGVLVAGGLVVGAKTASAQVGPGGGFGLSFEFGPGSSYRAGHVSAGQGCSTPDDLGYGRGTGRGYGHAQGPGYGFGGYNPYLPFSPAQQRGWREGRFYYETGIAPGRPLSPVEAQSFVAGARRAAETPWQLDPAKQRGWRAGLLYGETGIPPGRPLSPAEAEGFAAGARRAGFGARPPW